MSLNKWRKEIDEIDDEIALLLERRAKIVATVGRLKIKAGLPVVDEAREKSILERVSRRGSVFISGEAISCVFGCIIQESRRIQAEIIEREEVLACQEI